MLEDPRRIFAPVFALVALTFVVVLRILFTRIHASRARHVHSDDFRLGESHRVPDYVRLANRNYMNLLEMPLLFYVLALSLYVTQHVSTLQLVLAWCYVSLRVGHTLVHLTYNHVTHRLVFFGVSNVVLAVMWVNFWASS